MLSGQVPPGKIGNDHAKAVDEVAFELLSITIVEVRGLMLVEHFVHERAHLLNSFLLEGYGAGQGSRPGWLHLSN